MRQRSPVRSRCRAPPGPPGSPRRWRPRRLAAGQAAGLRAADGLTAAGALGRDLDHLGVGELRLQGLQRLGGVGLGVVDARVDHVVAGRQAPELVGVEGADVGCALAARVRLRGSRSGRGSSPAWRGCRSRSCSPPCRTASRSRTTRWRPGGCCRRARLGAGAADLDHRGGRLLGAAGAVLADQDADREHHPERRHQARPGRTASSRAPMAGTASWRVAAPAGGRSAPFAPFFRYLP